MPKFRTLTRKTLQPLASLNVGSDQTTFVAPNLMTMAQSIFEPGSEMFGIWEHDTPVGFLAIVDMSHPEAELDEGDDPDGIYIWRLMVDRAHQGQGYGLAALEFAKGIAREKGRSNVVTSVVDVPGGALLLYEAFGFKKTGRIVDDEVELILQPH
ncbi:GNAT family N-acetyltransferase [Aliiroseovarius sp. F47248L]|uniref:GNAT family N-acetyltransferase n=1 Tax=Aliiroseovarius sp. F47248L TaxID=2926420 RepID=UPI001FF42111|nr:GNAT family N-acetyltransferase [Aliiroseovarius sp. F47248L]MCK0138493.1 GNAT family N-acetyltransferase [Aliiroseovarius sp. F47248L]